MSKYLVCISFSVVYFIVIYFEKCDSKDVFDENRNTKQFSCLVTTFANNSNLNCEFSFIYLVDNIKISDCVRNDSNVLISVGMEKHKPSLALTNLSFICTSNNYLSVKTKFKDGDPKAQYIEMRTQKILKQPLEDTSNFEYKIHFMFPKYPVFSFFQGDIIKYTISDMKDPAIELNIFLEFFAQVSFVETCHLYNFHDNSPIIVWMKEMVLIPCIDLKNISEDVVQLKRFDGNEEEVLPVDNFRVLYDKLKGFSLNTTNFKKKVEGRFSCVSSGCSTYTYRLIQPDSGYSPLTDVYLHGPKFNFMLGTKEKQSNKGVTLSCGQYNRSIAIRLAFFGEDSKPSINESIKYRTYMKGQDVPTYFAEAEIPYLKEAERNQFGGWKNNNSNSLGLRCTNDKLPIWDISYDFAKVPFYYSHEHNAFICEGLPNIFDDRDKVFISLYHWECKNILQCELVLSHCVKEDEKIKDDVESCMLGCGIQSYKNENLCLKKIQSSFVPCTDVSKINEDDDSGLCKAIVPAKKGIAYCNAQLYNTQFSIYHFYFLGFDHNIYVDVELINKPPINAILKLTSLNVEDHFWARDYFDFRCEAHSFIYADGIHWFFVYANGSVLQPSKDRMTILEKEPQDEHNPESNVQFYFDDIKLVQVVCSVPLLHTNDIDHISMDVKVFDQVKPEINSDTTFYLKENVPNQLMPCQTFGIPTPVISWEMLGQEIEDPLTIMADHILVFPDYNESFFGEYTCIAKSIAGNTSKVFSVRQAEDPNGSKLKLYYTITGLVASSVMIVAIIFIVYFRMQKERKRQQMEEIVRLVEGQVSESVDAETTDPLQQPFNKSYEIQKEDFTINWNRPLGSGEFGEVYLGKLNQIKEPIALKMLKKNAKIMHLKALASELKILMFVGEHPNLIKLHGAYKQDLERGILYVAVEFCGLGSMESYLRTNKHFFMKCPHLRSVAGESDYTVLGQVNTDNSEPFASLHTLTTLVKWCKQITAGMEHLVTKYVVHLDLATRNVLLTSEGNVKVTDFGLSRRMYNYAEYVKTSEEPMPWQWLAPESILLQKYSSKSDVWAFGITLWEIFTFGERPYPTFSFNEEFLEMIQSGGRCRQPKHSPNAIYKIMSDCWEYDPERRPSFNSLNCRLTDLNQLTAMEVDIVVHNSPIDVELQLENVQHAMSSHNCPSIGNQYTKLADMKSIHRV